MTRYDWQRWYDRLANRALLQGDAAAFQHWMLMAQWGIDSRHAVVP